MALNSVSRVYDLKHSMLHSPFFPQHHCQTDDVTKVKSEAAASKLLKCEHSQR